MPKAPTGLALGLEAKNAPTNIIGIRPKINFII